MCRIVLCFDKGYPCESRDVWVECRVPSRERSGRESLLPLLSHQCALPLLIPTGRDNRWRQKAKARGPWLTPDPSGIGSTRWLASDAIQDRLRDVFARRQLSQAAMNMES